MSDSLPPPVDEVVATSRMNMSDRQFREKFSWQPIETAPLDETRVLLCDSTGAIYIGFRNRWGTWDDGDFYDDMGNMTHWMPLPEPPSTI